MKVLFCHNYYRIRGGEDISFESDVKMLRDYGHEVVTLTRNNADISDSNPLKTTRELFWNHEAEKEAAELIKIHRPDVMHCNNIFPQISPSIYRAANHANVPIVQAIRNYRYFCPGATFYRDGKVCTDCLGKTFAYPAIQHGCYRESRVASAALAAMHAYHRTAKTWKNRVAMFFTPSQFATDLCIEAGFEASKIGVKTNFVYSDYGVGPGDGNFALFIGRLSQEKGVQTLHDAWTQLNPALPLKIIGEGDIPGLSNTTTPNVELLGKQPLDMVLDLLGRATCLVFTSLWFETFGRTIAEAFSRGTPVIASNLGVMADHIQHGENGFLFPAGDARALVKQIEELVADPTRMQQMRKNARQYFLDQFSQQRSYDQLIDIYQKAGVKNINSTVPNSQ